MNRSYRFRVDFAVLGPLRVTNEQGPIDIPGVKERTLLAMLIAHPDRMVPTAALVETLWGSVPPRSAAKSVQTFVLRVRNALEPQRVGPAAILVTDGPGYRLAVPKAAVDAERFVAQAGSGSLALAEGRAPEALSTLEEALGLWRGPAYAGFEATAFGADEARRLEEIRSAAVEDKIAAELETVGAVAAVPEVEGLLQEHPYRERLWCLLILALYRQGRQGDALAAYDRARRTLIDDLGVEPGRELRALHRRVLAQDPGLEVADRTAHRAATAPAHPMVGREVQLERLRALLAEARAGAGVIAVIRGPSGAGATMLAGAIATDATMVGCTVAMAGSPAAQDATVVIADHVSLPLPPLGQLVVGLADPDATPPPGAQVVDLGPLEESAVRDIVAGYAPPGDLDRAVVAVLARSGGWPGRVHREAADWVQRSAAVRVQTGTESVARSASLLLRARQELLEGVEQLREASTAAPAVSVSCPWKGLASYEMQDAPWFAGRERLVAELVARLAGSRLVGIVGPSGSGKSSALRAGLLARLAAGALPGSAGWELLVMRPGPDPMAELARQVLRLKGSDVSLGDVLEHLISAEDGPPDRRLVVAVDQLEEVWTACRDPAQRTAFLDLLADYATDPSSVGTIVLAMRPDFLGDLAANDRLAALLADNAVLVGAPTSAEIARAVQRPAAAAGLLIDDELTDAVVTDAGAEPGLLPLLSTALARLWSVRRGGRLTLAGYVDIGGLAGAIPGMAEEAYQALADDDRAAARMLFLRLSGRRGDGVVTRRRVPLAELSSLPDRHVRGVVEPLAAARLLSVSDDAVEVAHEALFTRWPRLQGWLIEEGTMQAIRLRLTVAAAEWEAEERDQALVWQGARLMSGLQFLATNADELTGSERAFLEAGSAHADAGRRAAEQLARHTSRQNRRLRWLLGGLAVVLVAALVASGLALAAQRRAQAATESADARRLAAQSVTEQHLDLGLLEAVEAVRTEAAPETYGALVTLLARAPDIVTEVHSQNRFLEAVADPDSSVVYLGENQPWLSAIDERTGQQLWRVSLAGQSGKLAAEPHGKGVLSLVSGADGQDLMMLDAHGGNTLWSVPTDGLIAAGGDLGMSVGWLPDGRWVAAGKSALLIGDGSTGRLEGSVRWPAPFTGYPDVLQVWPDGRVSAADAGTTMLVDPADRSAISLPVAGGVQAASRNVLAVVDMTDPANPTARLYDARSWQPAGLPFALPTYSGGIAFSADGSLLAVGAGDVLELRDGRTGELRRELHGHSGAVMSVVLGGSDQDLLWTAGRDGLAIAWDLSGRRGALRSVHGQSTASLGDTSAAGDVAVGLTLHEDRLGEVSIIDPRTAAIRTAALPMRPGCVWCDPTAVAITPDGHTVLAGIEEFPDDNGQISFPAFEHRGHLDIWDTATGGLRATVDLPWPVQGIDTTGDGRQAIVNGLGGSLLVDLTTAQILWGPVDHDPLDDRDATGTAAVAPHDRVAAVGTGRGLEIVDLTDGNVVTSTALPNGDRMATVGWSADAQTVVVGTYGGYLDFLRADDLRPRWPARLTTGGWVIDLGTTADGRFLASIGTDGDLLLWDASTGKPVGQPLEDGARWGWLSFDPDGTTLRAVHQDGTVFSFTVDPDSWIAEACAIANRDLTAEETEQIRPGQTVRSTCNRGN